MEASNSYDIKDSFMELEKSLATQAALKRRKKLLKILVPIALVGIIIILIIVIVATSKYKDNKGKNNGGKKEEYNGVFRAKYIIEDLSKKIKIINNPVDKLKLSVFSNNKKIIDLNEDETEISFNDVVDNTIEIKYQGKIINLFSLFADITNLEEIDLSEIDTSEVENMEKLFYGCTSLKNVKMNLLKAPKLKNINSMFENCENLE